MVFAHGSGTNSLAEEIKEEEEEYSGTQRALPSLMLVQAEARRTYETCGLHQLGNNSLARCAEHLASTLGAGHLARI